MATRKFTVTKDHIKVAQRLVNVEGHDAESWCPIALCIREALPDVSVYVLEDGKVQFGYDRHYRHLSKLAQRFVKDFDNERTVEPFSFYLNV